jgi:hypothetical protein
MVCIGTAVAGTAVGSDVVGGNTTGLVGSGVLPKLKLMEHAREVATRATKMEILTVRFIIPPITTSQL